MISLGTVFKRDRKVTLEPGGGVSEVTKGCVPQDSDCFVFVWRFVLFALFTFFLSFLWGAESENIHTWWFFLIFRAVPLTLHITAERILGVTCDASRFLGVVWGGGARENGNNPQVLLYSHHLPLIGGRCGGGKYLIGWAESLNIQQFFFDLK